MNLHLHPPTRRTSRRRSRPALLAAVALSALALLGAACGSDAADASGTTTTVKGSENAAESTTPAELVPIKFGIPWSGAAGTTPTDIGPIGYALSLDLAQPIFAQHGFEVTETVPFNNGPPTIEALHAGSVQVAQVGDIPVLAAQASGKDAIPIAVAEPNIDSWFISRDGGPAKLEDFAGKKVGLQFGSNFDKYGRAVLTEAGVIDDVELVNIPFPDALPALQRGDIDGYGAIGNLGAIWVKNNPGLQVLDKASDGDGSLLSTSVTIVTPDFFEQNPGITEAWSEAYQAGVKAIEDDPDAYFQWVSTANGTPADVVADTTLLQYGDEPVPASAVAALEADLAFIVEAGTAPKSFDIDEWVARGSS